MVDTARLRAGGLEAGHTNAEAVADHLAARTPDRGRGVRIDARGATAATAAAGRPSRWSAPPPWRAPAGAVRLSPTLS